MKRKSSRFDRLMLPTMAVGAMVASFSAGEAKAVLTNSNIWINEFHYDNASTDSNEFVEVVAPTAFTSLSDITLTLYNGSGGASYGTHALSTFTVGATVGDFTYYSRTFATDGIQNGSPDGFSLTNTATNTVLMFLSYEGSFTAVGGAANGLISTDIGVSQTGTTLASSSIQLQGTGNSFSDFANAWVNTSGTNTKGALNAGQTLTAADPVLPPPPPPPPSTALVITGIVDGNLTGGSPKFVEVVATENIADLSDFSLQLFSNGSASASSTGVLPSIALSEGDVFYIVVNSPAQQLIDFNTAFPGQTVFTLAAANFNGDDAIRLVEGSIVIDQFGVVGLDGTGQPWEYTDSYAFRNSGFGPNQVFTLSEWTFGGPGALPTNMPGMVSILGPLLGQFNDAAVVPEPVTFSLLIIGGVALMGRRQRAA